MSRILIVDDEPAIGWSLRELPSDEGHEVAVAADIPQAVAVAGATAPDVILLDVRLGHHDGLRSLPEIRAVAGAVPVIVMTSVPSSCPMTLNVGPGASFTNGTGSRNATATSPRVTAPLMIRVQPRRVGCMSAAHQPVSDCSPSRSMRTSAGSLADSLVGSLLLTVRPERRDRPDHPASARGRRRGR